MPARMSNSTFWIAALAFPRLNANEFFEPFYRLPGARERDGGVGLGLALVRQIAARHGGTVACLPRDGGGTCFRVRLPPLPPVSSAT